MASLASIQDQQLFLWEDMENIHVKEVASQLNVSISTVHNWQKQGLLKSVSANVVTISSVETFVQQYVGKKKLCARANKLHKERDKQSLHDDLNLKGDEKGLRYEASLSDAMKNKEGIYYTPKEIVADMYLSLQNVDWSNKLVLEPCCGCGNFVIEAIRRGAHPNNIYAFDTDETAVRITQQRIYELTGMESPHIQCADFLQISQRLKEKKFDIIFTNPPWGKKITKEEKERFAKIYQTSSKDSCSLFLAACLSLLGENGLLGFLLPESFFNISTFEDIRCKVLHSKILMMKDYGKPFKGLMTRAQSLILSHNPAEECHEISCIYDGKRFMRRQYGLANHPKHIFNFWISEMDGATIEHLFSFPHTTVQGKAQWGLGIVTGDNSKFLKKEGGQGLTPIVRGKDITTRGVMNSGLFIVDNHLTSCQQVAPISLYKAQEKLIYRFISDSLVFVVDNCQRYILNSANMLILNEDFPINHHQLAHLLNSTLMNWLFKKLFRTHKILRGDLECLPIFADFFKNREIFNENELWNYLGIEYINGDFRIKR